MLFEGRKEQAFIEILPLRVWKYKKKRRAPAFKEPTL